MEIKVFTITQDRELATFKLRGNLNVKAKKIEIKIKNNNEYIPATLEVVDGVMIVSPKEEKVDVSQFKDGATWADETMIDKACEWLDKVNTDNYMDSGIFQMSELICDFRKAMKG